MKTTRQLYHWLGCLLLCISSYTVCAQTDSTRIRIVDTLSAGQKKNHNRVLLRSELDSLLKLYSPPAQQPATVPQQQQQQPVNNNVPTDDNTDIFLLSVLGGMCLVLLLLFAALYRNNRHTRRIARSMEKQQHYLDQLISQQTAFATRELPKPEPVKSTAGKQKVTTLENKVQELTKTIEKLAADNQRLQSNTVNGSAYQAMYTELTDSIAKTFKIKNYPHNGEAGTEHELLLHWLETERLFAANVYEKYVKPVHSILETNKKDPAHTSTEEKNRLSELLVSLSLLYMEYLYLRVAELSIGGKIAERINQVKNAAGINTSALKQLDVEHGSKALVLHLTLLEKQIGPLSYPVLDETNLNRK